VYSAVGVLDRALYHSFALARLKSPISKGGTETDNDFPPVFSEKDERKMSSMSIILGILSTAEKGNFKFNIIFMGLLCLQCSCGPSSYENE
jgi:hypothetical protein